LRPALQVLARELANQYSIEELHRSLSARDGDIELVLAAAGGDHQTDDFDGLLRTCVKNLGCVFGALLVPDKHISLIATGPEVPPGTGTEILSRTHRHLLAWTQVQRRSMALNKSAPTGPLGNLPFKLLASPIMENGQRVVGLLVLFRSNTAADFAALQIRIAELLARRLAGVMQNDFEAATGLLTRGALDRRVLQAIRSSPTGVHSVIFIDIDRLHAINENHGMHVGDEVIIRVAEVIRAGLAPRMAAAHIAGDRFAVFLPNAALGAAQATANSLRTAIAHIDYKMDNKAIVITASAAAAQLSDGKHPLSHALANAELACKQAKEAGGNRVEIYEDAVQSAIRRNEDVEMLGRLRDALAHDRFRLDAQPIITLGQSARPHRYELFLRMIDGNQQTIAPDKFMSVAERHQLAPTIDRWVLEFVLELLSSAASRLQHLDVHFSVNLSSQSIGDDSFATYVEDKLAEYALPPSLISFEITEAAAVTNIVRAEALMRRLRDLGHEIALDDFGRGLSSLTYLQSLPASCLKIDGALIRDVVGNPRAQAMITAIVQLAAQRNLITSAECVESEAILRAVTQLGVHWGQGFHIGRPKPFESVLKDILAEATGGHSTSGILRGISRLAQQ
jgi:diguanylate cyclase (GGDEF)-like protein